MCAVISGIILIIRQICRVRQKKMPSPFLLFGIMNALFLLFMVGYGIYDILTDTGFMAGTLGNDTGNGIEAMLIEPVGTPVAADSLQTGIGE